MKLLKNNKGRCSCLQRLQAATCLAEKPLMVLVLQVKSPQYKAAIGASDVSHQHNILVTLQVSVFSKAGDSSPLVTALQCVSQQAAQRHLPLHPTRLVRIAETLDTPQGCGKLFGYCAVDADDVVLTPGVAWSRALARCG